MNETPETTYVKKLGSALAKLATREHLTEVLGITEEMSDEFWKIQGFTVMNRFFAYMQFKCGNPLTTQYTELSEDEAFAYLAEAGLLLSNGLTYHDIRNWWLSQGCYMHRAQQDARHQQRFLDERCVRVLVFFENENPKYLAFDGTKPKLVADKKEAHRFPVYAASEQDKEVLRHRAAEFVGLLPMVNGKELKVLFGLR